MTSGCAVFMHSSNRGINAILQNGSQYIVPIDDRMRNKCDEYQKLRVLRLINSSGVLGRNWGK